MSAFLQLAMPLLRRIVVALALARLEAALRRVSGQAPRAASVDDSPSPGEPPTVAGITKPPYEDNGA